MREAMKRKRGLAWVLSLVIVFTSLYIPQEYIYATQNRSGNYSQEYVLSGNGADDIVKVAKAQIGKTGSQLGYSEEWCADFVGDCAALANQGNAIPRDGYCPSLQSAIRRAGGNEVDISSARKGDLAFYGTNGSAHVEIVYANNNGTISTIGGNSGSGSSCYSRSVRDHGYQTMTITKVLRPNYSSASAVLPGTIDSSWNVPTNVTASRRITTYDQWANAESNHYIDPGDKCYVSEVYTNGFAKVKYPTSNGDRWAYAKASDFSLSKKQISNPVNLGTDFYAYIINTYAWKHLTNDSYNVTMRSETGQANQIWKFERQSDGSYKIINCKDNNVLDVTNFGTTNGTNVAVCGSNNSTAQRWYIYGSSGAYHLKAKCGDLALDVNGGVKTDGTNIQMWEWNDTVAQKFQIWKLDKAGASKLSVGAGTSTTNTNFSWTSSSATTHYVVKIWKDKVWQGNSYKEFETKSTNWSVKLPEGTYEAYVDSNNAFSYTCSNIVRFTVKKGECTHQYGSWSTTKKASCTANGTEQRKCSLCGKVDTRTVKATGHKFTDKVVAATSTQKGYTLHTCSNCGYSYKDKYTEYKKLLSSILITTKPKKIEYYISEQIDTTGLKVTAKYSDGTSKIVSGYKISGDTKSVGNQKVTVSYTEGSVTKTTSYKISVKEKPVQQVTLTYDTRGGVMSNTTQTVAVGSNVTITSEIPQKTCCVQLDAKGGNVSVRCIYVNEKFRIWHFQLDRNGNMVIGPSYRPGETIKLENNMTVYAVYDGGEIGELPTPTREGYTFMGWYQSNGVQVNAKTAVASDCTLTAQWEKREHEHTPGEWTIIKEATATETGKKVMKCQECGEIIETLIIPVLSGEDEIPEYELEEEDEDEELDDVLYVGDEITTDQAIFTITRLDGGASVEYTELFDEDVVNVTVPDSVSIDGTTYKVTSIASKAFYKNKSIKSVVIGKYVTQIGSKAFYGCSSLKKIVLLSNKITSGNISSSAFSKVTKNVKVYVPSAKYKSYKKMLKKAGIGSKAKIYKMK